MPPVVVDDLAEDDPDLLTTLRTSLADAEVLSTPTPPLDPSSAAAAGLGDVFSRELRTGEDVLEEALPASPPQRSGWLVDSPISTSAATMLRDPLGFDLLVFDANVYNELEGGIGGFHDPSQTFDIELAGGATLPGFLVSPSSHWLDRGDLDRRQLTPTDGAVRLMAELAVRQQQDPALRRSVVLRVPSGTVPDPEVAATLATYVSDVPGYALAPLGALPAATDVMQVPGRGPEAVRLPAVAGPDLSARIERVNVTRLTTTSAASMLEGTEQADAWNAELDALLSTGITDRAADAELDRIDGEVHDLYADVEAPRPFTFTLTGRRSTLRLNIRNNGTELLHVVVRPSSPKLRFPEGDVATDLAPSDVTEVVIPVQAQTNGTSAIGIEIVTPVGGETVQGPVVLTARVNALSGLGQVVTGGALLVLLSWWYGHFRRRRRVRRAMLGEVDNPSPALAGPLSPDAAEATAAAPVSTNGDGVGADDHGTATEGARTTAPPGAGNVSDP